ncbi:DUF1206 domain-containing protein [Jatrophihabitans fulvus]
MTTAQQTKARAEQASNGRAVDRVARVGLTAHGAVYVLIGILALALAFGERSQETDQRGALEELASHSGGTVLVWILAIGLFAYALWRLVQAVFGSAVDGEDAKGRAQCAIRAVIYGFLGVTAVQVAAGSRGSQSGKSKGLTADVLQANGGRWLVGVVGVVVAGVGCYLAYEGLAKKFEDDFKLGEMRPRERRTVEVLGVVGNTARGAAVVITGVLVVLAAVQADPKEAGGLDQALRKLASNGFGTVVLVVIALGLLAFGVFGFAEARWRRTR